MNHPALRRAGSVLLVAGVLALLPAASQADPYRDHRSWVEYREPHGHVVPRLSHRHRTIVYGGMPYYYDQGLWYRPWQGSFVLIAPPVGIAVPVLPRGVVTVYAGGQRYYRHGEVYYVRRGDGYVVVDAPDIGYDADSASERRGPLPQTSDDLYIYPGRGQSERQQRNDRFECHEWAAEQTGYDPTVAGGGSGYSPTRRGDYLRAMSACLEARGYTVR